jgi:Na+-driven multidrug efflux pump
MIPALYFMNLCDQQAKFLTFMRSPNSVLIAQMVTTSLHPLFCFYFVEIQKFDVVGLSYASFLSFFLEFIWLLLFT